MKNDDEFSEGKTQRNLKKLKEISKKLKEFGEKLKEIFEKLKKSPTFSWNLLRKNVQKKAWLFTLNLALCGNFPTGKALTPLA